VLLRSTDRAGAPGVVGSHVGMSGLAVRRLSVLVVFVGVAGVLVVSGSGAPRRPRVVAIIGSAGRGTVGAG
jgi:hypothetical protein